ncbi:MAG: hypothetical protein APF77_01180 [Clostridia bacterium BRH_c25]|nr:MAG: hypothetical protein APF77_01180 [Clostridia bacterium BRH_c25]
MYNIGVYLSYGLMTCIFLLIGLLLINKLFKKKFIRSIIDILLYFAALILLCFFIYMFIYLFLTSVIIVFTLFKFVLVKFFDISELTNYLSLTFTLMLFIYIPEKIGYWILYLIEKVRKSDLNLANRYLIIVKALRLKLFIYFVSFLLVLVSSMETFSGRAIVHNSLWLLFKPVILQSVVTVITFDRFLKLAITEWNNIKLDISKVKDLFLSLFSNKNKDIST